jgi:uncharacterized protein involved in exopolysaccharide biosynthesis
VAVQIESRGQIQDFLDVLRRRAWQIVVPAIFVITIGSCLAVIIPRKFLAKTQIEVRQSGPTLVGKEGQNASFQITAPERIKSVIEEKLRPPVYQALSEADRTDFLKDVVKNLRVTSTPAGPTGSIFVTITYTDVDRVFAKDLLRALSEDWQKDVLEQDRNRLQDEKLRLGDERDGLERKLKSFEEDLSTLKKDNGLSAMQPVPGTSTQQTEDPEYNRLQQHKGQVAEIDLQLAELHGKKAELEKTASQLPATVPSSKVLNGSAHEKEIAQTEADILKYQEKLKEYKPPHSEYAITKNKIVHLQQHLEDLQGSVTESTLATVDVENPALTEIRTTIAKADGDIAGLNAKKISLDATIKEEADTVTALHDVYRKVRLLEDKIKILQTSLSAADLAYQRKVQESAVASSSKNNPFAIIEEVNAPLKATEPNPWLIILLSVAGGLGIGTAVAVLLEYTKSCFRSVIDVSRVLPVPVLGNINRIVTRRESKHKTTRRMVVAATTFLVLGTLAFVTWAWAHDQDSSLLSPALRKAIEGLRAALK